MVQFRKLDMDGRKKEKIVYQNQMLHYGLYVPRPEAYFFGDIPWHWHDEFEFGHILGGSMQYKTNHHEFILHEGDGIFVNSGVLHYLHPLEPVEEVRLQSQFFDRSFLAGASGSILDIKYIVPVLEQKQLDAVPLYCSDTGSAEFLEKMREGAELSSKGEPFFELRLRNLFSKLWEMVYSWAMDEKKSGTGFNALEDERIKQMLSYIQEHYSEKITVQDIASSIHISERGCYRLFQTSLGETPVEFMISLRLQKAQELLRYTDKSVLEVAVETGFGTSSYFGKIFKQYHHITPKQYKKLNFDRKEHPEKET